MTDKQQEQPTPPVHARDDAESVEQAEATPRPSGNATDNPDEAPAVAGVTLYGADLPVELRYDKQGPEVTVTVGDKRHPIANLHRFQLTHDAKDALPKLAFWTYPLDGTRALSASAELYDVVALERAVQRAVVHAASAREFGRQLALRAVVMAMKDMGDTAPPYGHCIRVVERAESARLADAATEAGPPATLGDEITRAWLLAEDARRVADDDALRVKLGADGSYATMRDLLRSLSDATRAVTERLAALTVRGAGTWVDGPGWAGPPEGSTPADVLPDMQRTARDEFGIPATPGGDDA